MNYKKLNKRGIFFSVDALVSLGIILGVMIVFSPYVKYSTNKGLIEAGIIDVLSVLKVGEINNDYIRELIDNKKIEDLNKSILEQIAEFYVTDKTTSKEICKEMLNLFNSSENIGIWYYDELLCEKSTKPFSEAKNVDVERIIISRLPQVIKLKTSAFWYGVIGLTFTSTWIFSSVRTILNQIFDVKVERGIIYGYLRDIMMVLLLLILVSFATFIIPAVNIIYKLTNNTELIQNLNISSVWNSIVYVSSLALMFGLFFALYYLIPYEKLGKKVAAMSALWTTLLWEVARIIFGYYSNNILRTNPFYGAFILIIAVLFWVYYSACLFIIGAEIGQLYRERLITKSK